MEQLHQHNPELVQYEMKSDMLYFWKSSDLTPFHHFHSHVEVVCKHRGTSLAFADGHTVRIEAGDLFWTFPNQIHHYQDIEPGENTLLLIPEHYYSDYRYIFYSYLPKSPCIKGFWDNAHFRSLWKLVTGNVGKGKFGDSIVKGYLCALMGEILENCQLEPIREHDFDALHAVVNYCSQNYVNKLTLDSLEKQLHISKYHISHLFSAKMKISFNDYINSLRVADACSRLRGGQPITETALLSGFSTIRSFNRAFAKHMGTTPREYCRQNMQSVAPLSVRADAEQA